MVLHGCSISIGPVHKRDVVKASAQLEFRKEFATVMAFDVPVDKEAHDLAEKEGIKIFTADIIVRTSSAKLPPCISHSQCNRYVFLTGAVSPIRPIYCIPRRAA